MSDTYFLVFGIVVALIGLVVLILYFKTFCLCRKKVTAEIVCVKEEQMTLRGSTIHSYRPRFSYNVDGKEYFGDAPFTSVKESKYNEGDPLEVIISESNPELFRFRGRIGGLITGIIMFCVGGLFVFLYFV